MARTKANAFMIHRPAMAFFIALLILPALACAGGPTASPGYDAGPAAPSGDVLFLNGVALTAFERAQIEALIGPLPAGRYWLDQNGFFGPEGGAAMVDLMRVVDLRDGDGSGDFAGTWMDYGPFSVAGSDGEACYYDDPESGAPVIVACSD